MTDIRSSRASILVSPGDWVEEEEEADDTGRDHREHAGHTKNSVFFVYPR
jgi:hypothetical protein